MIKGKSVAKGKKTENPDDARKDLQANISALLYLLTEQQVMIGRLLQELERVGALNLDGLNRITETCSDPETRTSIYTEIYNRYAGYTLVCRRIIDGMDEDKDDE